jgi:hypothetical protein
MAKTKTTSKGGRKRAAQDADIARKIWLAGVGAYDRMYNETQGAAGKLAKSANETFHQLVAKGEEVEDSVRARLAASPQGEKVSAMMEAWTSRAQKLTEEQAAILGDRLGKVRKSVAQSLAPWNVAALGAAVDKLSGQVDALAKEVKSLKTAPKAPAVAAKAAAPKTVKPAAKKAAKPAAKPAAKAAAKPAAKKAPAKKAPAKK